MVVDATYNVTSIEHVHTICLPLYYVRIIQPVFVCFFTITGAALKLSILAQAVLISSILVFSRMAAIFVGAYLGNR